MSNGFWMRTGQGNVAHVLGDRDMSDETAEAVAAVIDAAAAQMDAEVPRVRRLRPLRADGKRSVRVKLRGITRRRQRHLKRAEDRDA